MNEPQTDSVPHLPQGDGRRTVGIIDVKPLMSAILVGMAMLVGCQPSQTPEAHADTSTQEPAATPTKARTTALAAKDALFARLSGRLTEVMQANGPAAAIEVCSHEAAEIARSVGEEQGVTIGRTSMKLRNPKNAPPDWVQPFVEKRTAKPQFVDLPDGHTGALLPITLKSKCLACHGTPDTIPADVKTKLAKLYPHDQATGFKEGDLRGWFWVVVPPEVEANASTPQHPSGSTALAAHDHAPGTRHGRGMGRGPGAGRGMGQGRGMMGRGRGSEMREDMTTLHAMFDDREKINRTVENRPNGAVATTESDDEKIAALIQMHVPAMESRVQQNKPLPPMTFHPIFVQLIKHADDYTLTYEETDKGMKVTYEADDPFVIMLVQEHAQLVSRFIKNGMQEIHKPYTLPKVKTEPADDAKR